MRSRTPRTRVYLDHAAATPFSRAVRAALIKAESLYGNPSATHEEGRTARSAIDRARREIAESLSVKSEEITFTSGGTESNNLAILGTIRGLNARGIEYSAMHVISSTIEHAATMGALEIIEAWGVSVARVPPNSNGIIEPESIVAAQKDTTVLITLAEVNSEIGTIQPIKEIVRRARKQPSVYADTVPEILFPIFHADCAQSPLYLDASPHHIDVDLVSYDAQKVMGPKGVGILYRNFSVPLLPIMGGGSQERGIRAGTENTAGIVATAVAFAEAKDERARRTIRVTKMREYLAEKLKEEIPELTIMGSMKQRIAHNVHCVFPNVDGDYLAVLMDREGVAVSPRSACSGSTAGHSHVVFALTNDMSLARGTIRFSLGPNTTKKDCDRAVRALVRVLPTAGYHGTFTKRKKD
jgi:cysteine desulfurase